MIRLCTFNIHRTENPQAINQCLLDYNINIYNMQEVAGLNSLYKIPAVKNNIYEAVFDDSYKTYGNGMLYNKSKFTLIHKETHIISNH